MRQHVILLFAILCSAALALAAPPGLTRQLRPARPVSQQHHPQQQQQQQQRRPAPFVRQPRKHVVRTNAQRRQISGLPNHSALRPVVQVNTHRRQPFAKRPALPPRNNGNRFARILPGPFGNIFKRQRFPFPGVVRPLRRADQRRQQRKQTLPRPQRYSKLANQPAETIKGYTKFTLDDVIVEDDEEADEAEVKKDEAEVDTKEE